MAASSIVVNSITPNLYILGDNQKIFFSDPINNFSFINNFTPLSNVPTTLKIGIFNVFNNGYVFEHNTSTIDNFGSLKLKSVFNNNTVDLLSIDNNIFTFNIPVIVPTPTLNNHAATKSYIDNKTWTVSQITNFNSSVVAFRLDQFAIPTANINLNGNKIIGLGAPTLTTDAATKGYVDSSIGSISMSITLQGDVTGSGNTGSNITTTLNKTLDQINLPTTSLNLNSQKIINLATPTLTTDATNKSYVDGKTWIASQITDFDTQVRLSRLDQMASPITSLNANSQKIINLAAPTLSTDAVNKNYADTSTIAPSRITGYPSSTTVFLRGDGTWAAGNSGTVTSVGISGSTGLSVSGSPITASGTINLSLTTELQTLSSLTATGILSRNASGTYSGRTITASTGISISNGDGILGNPVISISTIPISNLNGYPSNSSLFLRGDGNWSGIPTIDINNGTSGQLSIGRLSGYPANSSFVLLGNGSWGYPNYVPISSLAGYPGNSSYFLRGDGQWTTTGGGSASLSSNSINVNTDGGSTNWLRRSDTTVTGVLIYGLTGTSFIHESNNGESAGIGFDGGTDTCTIWTAGDGGTLLNIQDEDSSNSRNAYVSSSGAWTQVSSQKRKHSIKNKNNNNVLDRFLKLSVKSYGYKYQFNKNLTEKQKRRIEKKSNKMSTGLILEELFAIFPNCIPDYYNKLFEDKRNKDLILEEEIKNPENSGIDYNTLMCYFIMAFQEYANKTDKLILELQNKVNNKKV